MLVETRLWSRPLGLVHRSGSPVCLRRVKLRAWVLHLLLQDKQHVRNKTLLEKWFYYPGADYAPVLKLLMMVCFCSIEQLKNSFKNRTSMRNQLLIDNDPYIPVWSVAGSTPLSNFFSSSWTFDFSDPSGVVGTDLSPSRFEIMAKINLFVAYLILPFWLAWLLYQE